MNKPFDVAALGEAMIEFNQTRAGEPQYLQGFGGDTSNAVIAAARAGARTAYLTRIGQDRFGDELIALWQREGVDTKSIERDAAAHTAIYFVTHGPKGHEFSYLRAGSAASRMTPQWLPSAPVADAKILHVSGISLAISTSARDTAFAAMVEAKSSKTLVSFDSNLRLKLWSLEEARAGITQAVALCDIFLPSVDDVAVLSGLDDPDAIVDWSHSLGAATVVLKLGSEGCLVSDGARRTRLAGHVVPVADATGAGDCFCGNLLARMAQGDTVFDAARYANAAAALAVQGFGAVAPLPRPDAVNRLLEAAA
ncbi:MAG: sugar kinase [Comamonadaceae bacterium]|nr:MAG: sugar kinase [Comamonadaceae bacterium]